MSGTKFFLISVLRLQTPVPQEPMDFMEWPTNEQTEMEVDKGNFMNIFN